MSILGLGNDIVNIKRIEKIIKNNEKNFLLKILHKDEKKFKKLTVNIIAKKFAAKESFSKALGTGFRKGLNFKDVEILNDNLGKPYFRLNNKTKKIIMKTLKVKNFDIFLSISDEKEYSIAFTIIQAKNV